MFFLTLTIAVLQLFSWWWCFFFGLQLRLVLFCCCCCCCGDGGVVVIVVTVVVVVVVALFDWLACSWLKGGVVEGGGMAVVLTVSDDLFRKIIGYLRLSPYSQHKSCRN